MGMGFSKLFGGDKPLIKMHCVFINRSNDVVVGEDGVDSGSASISSDNTDDNTATDTDYRTVGCIQWRQKEKMKTTVVVENENAEN
jgi:hypothetical protein